MWIKICGVTTTDDAAMIVSAGADAIGLNFYPQSKRFVQINQATAIRSEVGDSLDVVGVFVNSTAHQVADIAQRVNLTAVQFHGDESVETIAEFHHLMPETGIVRAFRVGADGTAAMSSSIKQLTEAGIPLAAVLVDALVAGEYGGTGHSVDANQLQDRPSSWPRMILAGGLTPDSVANAAAMVQPWGVDTASGVETEPGIKCEDKTHRFIAAVRPGDGDIDATRL